MCILDAEILDLDAARAKHKLLAASRCFRGFAILKSGTLAELLALNIAEHLAKSAAAVDLCATPEPHE